ncbi:hypothetical protein AX16_009772 [Volvariella volvacea WC 439]|nr:hypothetical protein AX16_009772 [Volvariella volvacea WC 439]
MSTLDNINIPDLSELPTARTLTDARQVLHTIEDAVTTLTAQIEDREAILARIIREYKEEIHKLQEERSLLKEKAYKTRAYLSPIRRLPAELLGEVLESVGVGDA